MGKCDDRFMRCCVCVAAEIGCGGRVSDKARLKNLHTVGLVLFHSFALEGMLEARLEEKASFRACTYFRQGHIHSDSRHCRFMTCPNPQEAQKSTI